MKLSGYRIRLEIDKWITKKNLIDNNFRTSLWSFEGEEKVSPHELAAKFKDADYVVAALQDLQQTFNHATIVTLSGTSATHWNGTKMSLSMAVKLLGGAGRLERLWQKAVLEDNAERGYRNEVILKRNKDDVYAKRAISSDAAQIEAFKAKDYASSLREAVAIGNAAEIEVTDIKLIALLTDQPTS